jgi:hypothetical protein
MKTKNYKKIFASLALSLTLVSILAVPAAVFADADSLLWGGTQTDVETALGLGNEDPRTIVSSVVSVLLGFLGILAVLIILFAGFKWMTAGGNDDNISSAKSMMTAGVIGLVIVLASFGLSQFVIEALYNATGATG